ncbi:MAG: type II secretion system protein [Magnetococcales bacterium]|nr:type II secretion system protein [Magnetococcales bacterium]
MNRHAGGFTLIEIAVVLVIFGSLMGGALTMMHTLREKNARERTAHSLDQVQEALLWYAAQNRRLPCPDIDFDGQENRDGGGLCVQAYGLVPSVDLGVEAKDPWTNYLTYHVTPAFANADIDVTTTGNLIVDDVNGAALGSDFPVVVVSHGKNGEGRYLTNSSPLSRYPADINTIAEATERANADADSAADPASRTYVRGGNDDIILWIPPFLLKNHMLKAGQAISTSSTTTAASTSVATTTSAATTSVSTTTSAATTSVSTTTSAATTSVSTTTTSVSTTTTSAATTSVSTTTTSASTTSTSTSTSTSTTSTVPQVGTGDLFATETCWNNQSRINATTGETTYPRRASSFVNQSADCPVLPSPGPNLCYVGDFTRATSTKANEDYFVLTLSGQKTDTSAFSLTCQINDLSATKTQACTYGTATFTRFSGTTGRITVPLSTYDGTSLGASGFSLQYFGEDSAQSYTVFESVVPCS